MVVSHRISTLFLSMGLVLASLGGGCAEDGAVAPGDENSRKPNSAPSAPGSPLPSNDVTGVSPLGVQLSWTSSDPDDDPVSFQVYFGVTATPPLADSMVTDTVFSAPTPLLLANRYYWRVAARDDHGHRTVGPLWSFTTAAGSWHAMTSPTQKTLYAVWGASSDDVFAVGADGLVLRYDGTRWTSMPTPVTNSLLTVWGASGDDVYAAGVAGALIHYTGTAWVKTGTGGIKDYSDIWGDEQDVFVAACDGSLEHYDGDQWSSQQIDTMVCPNVWWRSDTDAFLAAWSGEVMHYDGTRWRTVGRYGLAFNDIAGSPTGVGFAVGDNGVIFRVYTWSWENYSVNDLNAVWLDDHDGGFAVGDAGTIVWYEGSRWTTFTSPTSENLYGVWGEGINTFVVGNNGTLLRFGP